MEILQLLLLTLSTQIATSTVRNLDQVHRLALEGNLTRFVHFKVKEGQDQAAALAGVSSMLNDDTSRDLGSRRRRLTSVEQPRRIFRPAGKFEESHAAFGLDRWFKIAVASNEDDVVEAGLAVEEALIRIEEDDTSRLTFEHVEPALQKQLHYRPNDPQRGSQDHYDAINLDAAHDITAGSSDVVVAVVDSGLQLSHPDFQRNIWTNDGEICGNGIDDDDNGYVDDCFGYNFADDKGGSDLAGSSEHGTHCSGTIAADTDNGIGVAGVAGGKRNGEGGVKIMTLTTFGTQFDGGFEEALVYSVNMGARISSNSWGYTAFGVYEESVLAAINYAALFSIVVFSAGNDNSEYPSYPGYFYRTVNVAALRDNGKRAGFSNYGFSIDISAPGVGVLSTVFDTYGRYDGTSMACPHVAGVLALGFSINPGLSDGAALACLYSTASNVDSVNPGFENYLGAGMVDAHAFVQCAAAGTLSPTSAPLVDPTLISCDFEDAYLCGWTTDIEYGRPFSRTIGGTPRLGTGPVNYDSYFMYVDTSYVYYSDHEFSLQSPAIDLSGGTYELSFDFHMTGSDISILYVLYSNEETRWNSLERFESDFGSDWFHVKGLQIPPSAHRIEFRAIPRGSDICIDNVVIASRTPAPTASPSQAPTVAVPMECAIIVDGNPAKDSATACVGSPDFGLDDSVTADKTSRVAGTFCCGGDVAFCKFGCETVDFETARATCLSHGMRLCTESELLDGAATGSDCELEYMHVWSSTPALCPDAVNITEMIAECVAKDVPDDACKSEKLCAAVVDGNPSRDSMIKCKENPDMHLTDYFVQSADSAAGVRCCGDSYGDAISVCNDRCETVDYDEAARRCDEIGLRLCTASEVLNGVGETTGCAYDFMHVWVGERIECPDCASIVDGNPNRDSLSCDLSPDKGLEDSLTARMDSVAAGIRCCSEDGTEAKSFCDYMCQRVDYNTALSRCEEENMRLCTSSEILGGITVGTGCTYDQMHVWSAETTMCSESELSMGTTAVCVVDGSPKKDSKSVCGGEDWNAVDFKLVDPERDVAAVRCCSDEISATSLCPDGPCTFTDYQTAKDRCANINMRLCTAEELLHEEAAGTGCGYDHAFVWSSTEGSCHTDAAAPGNPFDQALKFQECIEAAKASSK